MDAPSPVDEPEEILMKLKPLLTTLFLAALPGLALAQAGETDSTKRIDKRQTVQEKQIEKGAKSGQISKKEAARLKEQQNRIDRAEKKAAADGKVTKEERARLERMQDTQGRQIQNQRRDEQVGKKKQQPGAKAAESAVGASSPAPEPQVGIYDSARDARLDPTR
jgi:hypothetical protein